MNFIVGGGTAMVMALSNTLTLSADLLICGALILLVSAGVGFFSGVFYERTAAKRALSRARRRMSDLVSVVVRSLESAREACAVLDSMPNIVLAPRQLQKLEARQSSLLETVARVIDKQQALAEAVLAKSQPQPEPVEFALSWQREADAAPSALPDRAAFDANLSMLLDAGNAAAVTSGLLFIKLDKFELLQEKYGSGGATTLLRKMAAAVSRAGRDADLLCRYSADTLALLVPQVNAAAGRLLAQKVRDSVRSYHFRLDDSGPEIYMTASYGFTLCEPGDTLDLAVNRAGSAVSKSQRRGRNQLHLHDGETTVHCLAG